MQECLNHQSWHFGVMFETSYMYIKGKLTVTIFLVYFNENTFLKSVSTSKSRVTYYLDTDRVTYDRDTDRVTFDLDTNTTTHKIIGVVGSPSTSLRLYLRAHMNCKLREGGRCMNCKPSAKHWQEPMYELQTERAVRSGTYV